jgi:hypothetical protein
MVVKIVINAYIDVVWDPSTRNVYVAVAGKKVRYCSFLLVRIQSSSDISSIDDLANDENARSLEGVNVERELGMTPEEHLQAHASNIQAWVENDYNPAIIHSNIAFPLLEALAGAGDQKARRVLEIGIRERVVLGSSSSRLAMLESGIADYLDHDTTMMLARDGSAAIRLHVAATSASFPDVLALLSRDADSDVRMMTAGNPATPMGILVNLASDVITVREAAAGNRMMPLDVLFRLARDAVPPVRSSVAGNASAPPDLLATLSTDDVPDVREEIASNQNTPASVLVTLSDDPIISVRTHVAGNKKTPRYVILKLMEDASIYVRSAAQKSWISSKVVS